MKRLRSVPLAAAFGAYLLAFLQRPGELVADTKVDLHTGAVGFLADAAAAWAPSGGLGQVQAGQYAGYLWPMGAFHALGDLVGIAPWVVQRLWLGTLLALAAWGVVLLLDALLDRPRGVPHVVAAAIVVANPYVVTFTNRTSVTLLAYALLPWMLVCIHRGLRAPRGWWWPSVLALLVASLGAGVNAAVAAWVLLAPALFVLYEVTFAGVRSREALGFLLRSAPLAGLASLWWLVPVAVQVSYGGDFLPFTESAGSIWTSTSLSESLRLFGFWVSYLGLGYGVNLAPAFDSSPWYLFNPLAIAATFALSGLALGGYVLARRWRYAPFFLGLLLIGLLLMAAGWPEGAPLRRALTYAYYRAELVQFMRTTYKAAPIVALALACLGGVAAGELAKRLTDRRLAIACAAAAIAILAGAAWPLASGRAIDGSVAFREVPSNWRQAADGLDRTLPRGSRALVLPGQVFPYYRWGFPQDPILPALSERSVAVRGVVPYADLRSVELHWGTDSLVQQRRTLPGQLAPLVRLMGAGQVVVGSDDDPALSGAIDSRSARAELREGAGLGRPLDGSGSVQRFTAPAPGSRVRVAPARDTLVVDGSADALLNLASLGALPRDGLVRYAADVPADELRRAAEDGAEIAISDSNKRRAFLASRSRQTFGPTLGRSEEIPAHAAHFDPFPDHGSEAQTVAVLEGARSVRSPYSALFAQFPEHRPYAALDGDPSTYWVADRNLQPDQHWLEVDFGRPRDVPELVIVPQRESRSDVTAVEVAGRRWELRSGRNRLPVALRGVRTLRIAIADTTESTPGVRAPGALAEVEIPGLRVRERLRTPVLAARALRGADLSHAPLSVVLERTRGDDPYRRGSQADPDAGDVPATRNVEAALVAGARDPESAIARRVELPARRSFGADGWATVAPDTSDAAIDRYAGTRAEARYTSSARYQGRPGNRASGAFDGSARTAWLAPSGPSRPWIRLQAERTLDIHRLTLLPPSGAPAPRRVRVTVGERRTRPLRVGASGVVRLPSRLRGRALTIEVLDQRRLGPVVGIAEVRFRGAPEARVPRSGVSRFRCGEVSVLVDGVPVPTRPRSAVGRLDSGRPFRLLPCGREVALAAGTRTVTASAGPLRADVLRLRSPAPRPVAHPAVTGARVLDPGSDGRSRREGVRLAVPTASWLVLGESYSPGWSAECDGRDLGEPVPVDGYANGWRIPAGCRSASFAFGPQTSMTVALAVSGLVVLLLLAVVVLGRRGRGPAAHPPGDLPEDAGPRRVEPRRAVAFGAAAAVIGAALFSLRAGVVIGPVVGLILWRGVGTRSLVLAAAALTTVVLPAVYVLFPPEDKGGFNADYAAELTGAHWVAVAVWVLLALALSRAIGPLRAAGRADAAGRPGAP